MARIFSIINNKGGTGKTTTTLNLSVALVQKKKKVLVIDLDAQCNLSVSFGIKDAENHIGKLLTEQGPINDYIIKSEEGVDLIAASSDLLDYEYKINNETGREYLLKEVLESVEDVYDYILIDCPPSLSTLALNSMVASQSYIVPMQTENFAFIGLDKILAAAEKVNKRLNKELSLAGVLLIKFSDRTKFSQAVISNLEENEMLNGKIFSANIRQDISLMESSAFSQSVFEYAPESRGAEDYLNFATELMEKHG